MIYLKEVENRAWIDWVNSSVFLGFIKSEGYQEVVDVMM